MKKRKRRERPEPKTPRWFVVRRGYVQNYVHTVNGSQRKAMPLFSDRATCVDFIRHYMAPAERPDGETAAQYRPAEIGTVDGETLDSVLKMAVLDGVDEALWIQQVLPDTFTYRGMDLHDGGGWGQTPDGTT
jgi:hypothetical protein